MFMSVLALSIIQLFPSCICLLKVLCKLAVVCTTFMFPLEGSSLVNKEIEIVFNVFKNGEGKFEKRNLTTPLLTEPKNFSEIKKKADNKQ